MTEETCDRLMDLIDQVWGPLWRAAGVEDYEVAINTLSKTAEHYPSLSIFAHQVARESHLTDQPDSVNPEKFPDILGLIDNREKLRAALIQLPEGEAQEFEKCLRLLSKEWLPSLRSDVQFMVKHLPQRHTGGRHKKMPSPDNCRRICEEISKLHGRGVFLGVAHKRLATREGLSVRMVQRIWAGRKLKGSQIDSQSDNDSHGK